MVSAACWLTERLGHAPAITGLAIADIAAEASMSSASVTRAVRSRERLEAAVLATLANQRTTGRGAIRLWSALRRQTDTDLVRTSASPMAEAFELQRRQDDVVPLVGIWGFVDATPVRNQLAQSNRFLAELFVTELGAVMVGWKRRPRPPMTISGLVAALMSYGLGSLMLAALHPTLVDDPEEEAARGLLALALSTTEPGRPAAPPPPVDGDPYHEPAPLTETERVVADAAIRLLVDRGLPGPFDHLSVRSVTDAAGTSVGAFYSDFSSVDDFRSTIGLDHLVAGTGAMAEQLDTAPRLGSGLERATAAGGVPLLLRMTAAAGSPASEMVRTHLERRLALIEMALHDRDHDPDDVELAGRDLLRLSLGFDIHRRSDRRLVEWSSRRPARSLLDHVAELRLNGRWHDRPAS